MKRVVLGLVLVVLLAASARAEAAPALRVGSKRFTESYILAELVVALAARAGVDAEHRQGLGGTAVTYRALTEGAIDVYPEYSGTLAESLGQPGATDRARLSALVAPRGIKLSSPLGFQNTYALAMRRADAVPRVSDLLGRDVRFALSHEFAGRSDGWPGLAARYGLTAQPSVIDHALAYDALRERRVDVTDVYTTDAKIARYDLAVLEDNRNFFPPYEAVLLFRGDAAERLAPVLARLEGKLDVATMQRLNARVELDGAAFGAVAKEWLDGAAAPASRPSFVASLVDAVLRHGPRHLLLVFGSLSLSLVVGLPLGVVAYVRPRVGDAVLALTGVVQTIPSLALFCFFIPLLGIGVVPALAALFLYGLLPIVRNTHAGLASIPGDLREAARALGLSGRERLVHVELPLGARTILAGVKTSAVVAVGSATIAAFIGAGGFGDPISTGLALNDVRTILTGAVPSALLAVAVQGAFALLERRVVPRGLR